MWMVDRYKERSGRGLLFPWVSCIIDDAGGGDGTISFLTVSISNHISLLLLFLFSFHAADFATAEWPSVNGVKDVNFRVSINLFVTMCLCISMMKLIWYPYIFLSTSSPIELRYQLFRQSSLSSPVSTPNRHATSYYYGTSYTEPNKSTYEFSNYF